jgi:hypothetical protein
MIRPHVPLDHVDFRADTGRHRLGVRAISAIRRRPISRAGPQPAVQIVRHGRSRRRRRPRQQRGAGARPHAGRFRAVRRRGPAADRQRVARRAGQAGRRCDSDTCRAGAGGRGCDGHCCCGGSDLSKRFDAWGGWRRLDERGRAADADRVRVSSPLTRGACAVATGGAHLRQRAGAGRRLRRRVPDRSDADDDPDLHHRSRAPSPGHRRCGHTSCVGLQARIDEHIGISGRRSRSRHLGDRRRGICRPVRWRRRLHAACAAAVRRSRSQPVPRS